jgi:hypothetical protein
VGGMGTTIGEGARAAVTGETLGGSPPVSPPSQFQGSFQPWNYTRYFPMEEFAWHIDVDYSIYSDHGQLFQYMKTKVALLEEV